MEHIERAGSGRLGVGTIGNYYGSLEIVEENGKYFWGIEDYSGTYWEEIPFILFGELTKFEESRLESCAKEKEA